MRNIAEIIEDDRNCKQLSQTERQIAVAYTQGKYDAVMELNIINNTNKVLDTIKADILRISDYNGFQLGGFKDGWTSALATVFSIIDKYMAESEDKE